MIQFVLRLMGAAPEKVLYIGGSDVLPPPLSREEEAKAISAMVAGDEQAKSTLIEHNLRLVVYIARRFESTGINLEDLISIGTIGLIKAINTFRPEKNIKLATYASRCIENEILMYLRKIASHRSDVSLDEPINTDWDGNELKLGDVLGPEPAAGQGENHCAAPLRPGRRTGKDPEGGGGSFGHLPILHFPAGKAHYPKAAAGDHTTNFLTCRAGAAVL